MGVKAQDFPAVDLEGVVAQVVGGGFLGVGVPGVAVCFDVDFALNSPDNIQKTLAMGAVREIFQRGYKILLDKDDWTAAITQRLPGSFSDYDYHSLTTALQHQMNLYHDIATQVTEKLDITYPFESVQTVQTWFAQTCDF